MCPVSRSVQGLPIEASRILTQVRSYTHWQDHTNALEITQIHRTRPRLFAVTHWLNCNNVSAGALELCNAPRCTHMPPALNPVLCILHSVNDTASE